LVPLSSISLLAGSKRFFWLKETSEDISLLKQKIASARGSDLKIFNAYTATILESLQAGAHGYSGIATNFYPALFVWLKNNFEKDPDTAKELQAFFVKAQKVVDHKYLSSAKQFLILCGLPITPETRISRSVFINQEMQALKNIRDEANQWHKILELPPIC
jgi:4-hydroxy-tetrahydrodipicolinate synthase